MSDIYREAELPKEAEKYLKSIERKLNFPKNIRKKVMSDLLTGVTARRENGEDWETILSGMGDAKAVADGLNREMADYGYRKSKWRFAFLVPVAVGVVQLLFTGIALSFVSAEAPSIGVIGGADGPTAIFVTTSSDLWSLLSPLVWIAAGILGFVLLKHLTPKRTYDGKKEE